MTRPDMTIYANSMRKAQAARISPEQRAAIHAWADRIQAARESRGELDARPKQFSVPVRDDLGILIGHVVFPT